MKTLVISAVVVLGSWVQTQTHSESHSSKQTSGSSQSSGSAHSSATSSASAGSSANSGGSAGGSNSQSSQAGQSAEQHTYQLMLDGMMDGQTVHNESSSEVRTTKNSNSEKSSDSRKSTDVTATIDPHEMIRSSLAAGAYRMFRTRMMPVINTGFGPGQGWEKSLKPMFGRPEATVRFMVVGDDRVGQARALKVTFEFEEPAGEEATTASGVLWIDTKNGWPLRSEMDIKNLHVRSGLLDATVVETRIN